MNQYRDRLDPTRSIRRVGPGKAKGTVRCRISFDDTGFAGTVDLPQSLFEGEAAEWYGFYPDPAAAA